MTSETRSYKALWLPPESLSGITSSVGSQQPCQRETQAVLRRDPRVEEPSWEWLPKSLADFRMTAVLADILTAAS